MQDKYESHESFGVINISRVQGKREALFGSSISTNNFITLSISNAKIKRDYSRDWIMSANKCPIIEVEMSYNQFAEAITSFNQGSGTPVTIMAINGKKMQHCPSVSKVQQFDNEFKSYMETISVKINNGRAEISSLIQKLPQKTQKEITNKLDSIFRDINSNIPFIKKQFTEQMEKTVTEAKAEIEGFVSQKINSIGLKNLKASDFLSLEDKSGGN